MMTCGGQHVAAHEGPPFPIISTRPVGAYDVALWTDPDATDDGSAGGQFWVMLDPAEDARDLPSGTTVTVSIRPAGAESSWQTRIAEPVDGILSRQFAALVMDHEGRFDVRVEVGGPLGYATAEAWVDATYDLRPPPALLALYVMPFLAVGLLWLKLLVSRHRTRTAGPPAGVRPD